MYIPGDPSSSGSYDYDVMQSSQEASFKDMPKRNGHWDHQRTPIGRPPVLPENPTEEKRAEHHAADQKWKDQYYSISYSWVPDPKPEEKAKGKSLATTDRERPAMRALPRLTSKLPKINIHRHEAQCSVCRHPDRQIIEDEFVNWASPRATAKDFDIDFRAIYRHARVYNLIATRNRNVRGILSQLLERAEHVATPTADAIIRGVKAFTRVNDDGQWIEPPSRVIVSGMRDVSRSPNPSDNNIVKIPSAGLNTAKSLWLLGFRRTSTRCCGTVTK